MAQSTKAKNTNLAPPTSVRFTDWQRKWLDRMATDDGADATDILRSLVTKEGRRRGYKR